MVVPAPDVVGSKVCAGWPVFLNLAVEVHYQHQYGMCESPRKSTEFTAGRHPLGRVKWLVSAPRALVRMSMIASHEDHYLVFEL